MPGLVVAVGDLSFERVRGATNKLAHLPAHRSSTVSIGAELAIGWAGLPGCARSCLWKDAHGRAIHVWHYGHTFTDARAPTHVDAALIMGDYLQDGIESCFDYEGSFVIVIADMRANRVHVVPDRLCSQPLYYTRKGDDVVIGPEVKALTAALDIEPRLSMEGVVGFLANGYNIGTQTLFSDVRKLELGKMLTIELEPPRRMSARRFWQLDFDTPDEPWNRRDAEDALFESIKQGHRILLSDAPNFQLLLSGGADSRGILGTCAVLRTLPTKAVTWGLSTEVPGSDASISHSLAQRCAVPWDFIVTGTEGFVDNCEHWAYVSELSNDNFGWYAEGFGTLNYMHEMSYSCSFIGDECWGWRGFAHDEFQAYAKVLAPNVPPSLLALLREERRAAAAESYLVNLSDAMRDCTAQDWNERKDFLYLHGRVARFIFALGYNRGHATEQRRPFLTRAVLDVVRRLPNEARVHKNLYLTMLKRHLPEMARAPYASVDSLPDWSYDLRAREPLRGRFMDLVRNPVFASSVLGTLLDAESFAALRDAYFGEAPTPVAREARASQVMKSQIKALLCRSPGYKYLDRWKNAYAGSATRHIEVAPVDLLRRVAVLVLLERQLSRFQSL